MDKLIKIEINFQTIAKTIFFILALAGLYLVRGTVATVLFAIVVASAVDPAARWFEKRKIPRVLAVIFIYLVFFLFLVATFYLVIPNLLSEVTSLANKAPVYFESPESWQNLFGLIPSLPGSISSLLVEFFKNLQAQFEDVAFGFLHATAGIFGGVMSFVLVVVLSFYLSVQRNGLEEFISIIAPLKYEKYILYLWQRSQRKIGLWLQGQILLAVLVGMMVFLSLTVLRIDYALSLALLAAVFELIPIFGPILSAIPAVGVAFLQSPTMALVVVILYVFIQQFESHLIYPLVVRKILGIQPIITILALIIGWQVGGFFGILLSMPIAVTFKEILDDMDVRKRAPTNQ